MSGRRRARNNRSGKKGLVKNIRTEVPTTVMGRGEGRKWNDVIKVRKI